MPTLPITSSVALHLPDSGRIVAHQPTRLRVSSGGTTLSNAEPVNSSIPVGRAAYLRPCGAWWGENGPDQRDVNPTPPFEESALTAA